MTTFWEQLDTRDTLVVTGLIVSSDILVAAADEPRYGHIALGHRRLVASLRPMG